MGKPFITGSRNSKEMLHVGVEILRDGGSAMDAVEATIKAVEENPLDTGVGLGGIPNLLGVPQMDASIMDGKTLKFQFNAKVQGRAKFGPLLLNCKALEIEFPFKYQSTLNISPGRPKLQIDVESEIKVIEGDAFESSSK